MVALEDLDEIIVVWVAYVAADILDGAGRGTKQLRCFLHTSCLDIPGYSHTGYQLKLFGEIGWGDTELPGDGSGSQISAQIELDIGHGIAHENRIGSPVKFAYLIAQRSYQAVEQLGGVLYSAAPLQYFQLL